MNADADVMFAPLARVKIPPLAIVTAPADETLLFKVIVEFAVRLTAPDDVVKAPNELVPEPRVCVIDPAVIAAVDTFKAFDIVNDDKANVPPTAPVIVRLPAAPGLIVKLLALPELLIAPVNEIVLPVLAIVDVPAISVLPVQLMAPFVVTLPAADIVAAVAVKAPNGVAPTVFEKVNVPLPHKRVKAGLAATPSPPNVPLNVIL